MRPSPALLALLLVAACSGDPAGGRKRTEVPYAGGEPLPLRCARELPAPHLLQRLAVGRHTDVWLSQCGDLLVIDAAGELLLAGPDLATLAPVPRPAAWSGRKLQGAFAPTGDLLHVTAAPEGANPVPGLEGYLVDLATGRTSPHPAASLLGWAHAWAGERSMLWWCSDDRLRVLDAAGATRTFADELDCDGTLGGSVRAPAVVLARRADAMLQVFDLESGAHVDLGIAAPRGPGHLPDGRAAFRADYVQLDPTGRVAVHQERWLVERSPGFDLEGPERLTLVELAGAGSHADWPAERDEYLTTSQRDGTVSWRAPGDLLVRTPDGTVAGLGVSCRDVRAMRRGRGLMVCAAGEGGREVPAWVDLRARRVTPVPDAPGSPVVAADGWFAAGCPSPGDADECGLATARVVREGGAVVGDVPLPVVGTVRWVGDDASMLIESTAHDELVLVDHDGAPLLRVPAVPGPSWPRVQRLGDVLVFERGGSLEKFDLAARTHVRLAEQVEWVQVSEGRVAFLRTDGPEPELWAGAVP